MGNPVCRPIYGGQRHHSRFCRRLTSQPSRELARVDVPTFRTGTWQGRQARRLKILFPMGASSCLTPGGCTRVAKAGIHTTICDYCFGDTLGRERGQGEAAEAKGLRGGWQKQRMGCPPSLSWVSCAALSPLPLPEMEST
jgi:hypothetical protein